MLGWRPALPQLEHVLQRSFGSRNMNGMRRADRIAQTAKHGLPLRLMSRIAPSRAREPCARRFPTGSQARLQAGWKRRKISLPLMSGDMEGRAAVRM
jgi:hypothetical protein